MKKKTDTSQRNAKARSSLARGFGAGLRGHKLPTRKEWDAITTALGPCGASDASTVAWVLNSYRRITGRLQECVRKHRIGLGGEKVDDLVCDEVDRLRAELVKIHVNVRAALSPNTTVRHGAQAPLSGPTG